MCLYELLQEMPRKRPSHGLRDHVATERAVHRAMGFAASDPVRDYDGPGMDRVKFTRGL